jgi:hypothetical protein
MSMSGLWWEDTGRFVVTHAPSERAESVKVSCVCLVRYLMTTLSVTRRLSIDDKTINECGGDGGMKPVRK